MNILGNNNNNILNKNKLFLIILFNLLYYVNCNQLNETTPKLRVESTTEVTTTTSIDNSVTESVHVGTTPKIAAGKPLSRYEQGLEDYEEAVDRIEKEEEVKKTKSLKDSPFMAFIDIIGDAWISYRKEPRKLNDKIDSNNENSKGETYVNNTTTTTTTSGNTKDENQSASVGEGRASYIQGDPLNGYYDYIITEGSYKFWSAFQLATAALIIYSTFAAIYYSKVNPLTGDYDYVDYLSRSFHGRSMDEDSTSSTGGSYFSTIFNGHMLGTASHAFQFVMDAIDRIPE